MNVTRADLLQVLRYVAILRDNESNTMPSETKWCEYTCGAGTYMGLMPIRSALTQIQTTHLSALEREQYAQKSSKSQANYLAGRLLAKQLLNQHLGTDRGALSILHDAHGAPEVRIAGNKTSAEISISHSQDWVACILNIDGHRVGVDIEKMRPRKMMLEMAHHLMHEDELPWVNRHCSHVEGFYRYWTAKEALAKVHCLPLISKALRRYVIQHFTEKQGLEPWVVNDGTLIQHFQLPNTNYMGAWAIHIQDNAINT
jgi:phosphopantetheinyl transferase